MHVVVGCVVVCCCVRFVERFQVAERRKVRRLVKDIFEQCDKDNSGILDKKEFALVLDKARKHMGLLDLDLETDWASIRKVPLLLDTKLPADENGEVLDSLGNEVPMGVTFKGFESWWKDRAGIVEPDIPVLPEFMVKRIAERSSLRHSWLGSAFHRAVAVKKALVAGSAPMEQERPVHKHWRSLGARLRTLVNMKRQWGNLHEMYETNQESMYEVHMLGRWTRDPDSDFSAFWDLTSVVLLLYVSVTVPLRAGFDIMIDLWSANFFVDAFVDVFFIIDLGLNFRTAYYDKTGLREDRGWKMAMHYLRGWFAIDFVSCLPLGYISYIVQDDKGNSNFRAIKAFRLVRLSKMLRLARIKRILAKYGNNVNVQQYTNIGFTLFLILFLIHMLSCFFYMLGAFDEALPSGERVQGWVETESGWCVINPELDPVCVTRVMGSRASLPLAMNDTLQEAFEALRPPTYVLYLGSMQKVLNPLENVQCVMISTVLCALLF